ncbi:MAG: hypothetical protein ACKO85_19375 [Isosphaeraceae bacterium]
MKNPKNKKTWIEKRDQLKKHEIVTLEKSMLGMAPGTRLLIPTPLMIDSYVRDTLPGQFLTLAELRRTMANDHGAENACPLVTGIQLRIVAEAALDEIRSGTELSKVAPFWRVIHPGSPLAKKLGDGMNILVKIQNEEKVLPRKI